MNPIYPAHCVQQWPPVGIKPYYCDDAVCIIHGDCSEIVPTLGRFDLLLVDPPYGISADNRKRILSRSKLAAAKDYGESNWDSEPISVNTLCLIRGDCLG